MSSSPPRLILGSSSRYRRELLERLRIPFEVMKPSVDETAIVGESPQHTALRLAKEKAAAIAAGSAAALVIGSDQVASCDGIQIGKPGTHEFALAQLEFMQGKSVVFHTAICLHDTRTHDVQSALVATSVRFRQLSRQELEAYLFAERPYDCAGSAKSEGLGIVLLESIESTDPTALVGLPLITLVSMLRHAGIALFESS
jgi:septum formation protein